MNRKLISVVLVLMLCFSLAVSVSATSTTDFIIDEVGALTDAELFELNTYADVIYDTCGVGIFFVFADAEDLENYDITPILGDVHDYMIMMENDTHWITFYGGKGEIVDLAAEEQLRSDYDAEETYAEGISKFLTAAAEYFLYAEDPLVAADAVAQIEAMEEVPISEEKFFVYDDADLLTDAEEAELAKKLIASSKNYNAQLVVGTIASLDGSDIDTFDDYLYDLMDFGYGDDRDGVLLLVCMDPREYRIVSNGFAAKAIDEDVIDSIGDEIVSDLSDGNYIEAFDAFVQECDYYLNGYINGFPFNAGKKLIISLVVGILAGVVVAFVLKGQLQSVHKQERANVYVKPGSMQVTYSNDLFLYRNVTREKKESKDSSSGSSRSSGGGSF